MEVLSGRTLLNPVDLDRSVGFYADVLGLSIYREFGTGGRRTGVVFFTGGGFLELSGRSDPLPPGVPSPFRLWLQVADVVAEHARLAGKGVNVLQPPARMPWGLDECWVADPDGHEIALVEVPADHPIRRRLD